MLRPFLCWEVVSHVPSKARGSDTGRGQWTDIGDDSLTSYGNSYDDRLNAIRGL